MTNETDKQYAQRILFTAAGRIAKWEPAMNAAKEKTKQLSIALEAVKKVNNCDTAKKIAFCIQQEFDKASEEYCELFNMLQDDYKDRRKMSEYLTALAAAERRTA